MPREHKTTMVDGWEVGKQYRHYGNGNTYTLTGFLKGSTDDYHDGEWWVSYEDDLDEYTTPLNRFRSFVEVRRFSPVE